MFIKLAATVHNFAKEQANAENIFYMRNSLMTSYLCLNFIYDEKIWQTNGNHLTKSDRVVRHRQTQKKKSQYIVRK